MLALTWAELGERAACQLLGTVVELECDVAAGANSGWGTAAAIPEVSSLARSVNVTGAVMKASCAGAPLTASCGATTSFSIIPLLANDGSVTIPAPVAATTTTRWRPSLSGARSKEPTSTFPSAATVVGAPPSTLIRYEA